jgi:hypothetical protein
MGCEIAPYIAGTVDDVENSWWDAGLGVDFREYLSMQRSKFARFIDNYRGQNSMLIIKGDLLVFPAARQGADFHNALYRS